MGGAHLVHLEQGALSHLLQRANLASFRFPRQEHLAVASLAHLSDDVKLFEAEFRSSLSKYHAFATVV